MHSNQNQLQRNTGQTWSLPGFNTQATNLIGRPVPIYQFPIQQEQRLCADFAQI
jgi:hypothetical protein